MIVNEIIAIIIGYLLGSIPSAYIATRITTGKDIRQMGGGNVGGLNTYREVGTITALGVGIVDIGKGAAAVAIAYWLLGVPQLFVVLAGLAAVVGHNWMLFLKFSGGKGMGSTVGALAVLLPIYGYLPELLIFLSIILIVILITRNATLASGTGLLSLPFIAWFGMKSGLFVIFAIVLGLLIGLRFLPTARAAWAKAENKKDFFFDRWQRER